MEKKKMLMVAIDVIVIAALIICGAGLLLGVGGFTVDILLAFVGFGVAMVLVDIKSTVGVFLKEAGVASVEAKNAIDKIAADGTAAGKNVLKDVIDHAQKALNDLESKL